MAKIMLSEDKKTMLMLINGEGEISCDGKLMKALKANTEDASNEKHVPFVDIEGNKVNVKIGSAEHPMTEGHFIVWIYLQTKRGGQYRYLTPNDKPKAEFIVAEDDEAVAVYEYCNLHGLWKAELK